MAPLSERTNTVRALIRVLSVNWARFNDQERQRLGVFENRVLGCIFGPGRVEETGGFERTA
jgi:hypothetical protein